MRPFSTRTSSTGGAPQVHPTDRDEVYDLVERSRAGDRVAFAALYDLFFQKMYRYALARIGSTQDAEDVAAETMIQAWRALERFQWVGAPFVSWLIVLAQRRIATLMRERSRRPSLTDGGDTTTLDSMGGQRDEHADTELHLDVVQALQSLPERHRQVLAMRFFGGLSAEEIGGVLGMKAGAVRQLQLKALERLRYSRREGRRAA